MTAAIKTIRPEPKASLKIESKLTKMIGKLEPIKALRFVNMDLKNSFSDILLQIDNFVGMIRLERIIPRKLVPIRLPLYINLYAL